MSDEQQNETDLGEFVITPAGRLYLAMERRGLDARARLGINAALANEVAASRDLISIARHGKQVAQIQLMADAGEECACRYGNARIRADQAMADAGISQEIVRYGS